MVAFHGPHQDPQDPHSMGEGGSAMDREFRDAFSTLVEKVYSKSDAREAALGFTRCVIDALSDGRVPPEMVIECMRLRFPGTEVNVFVATGCYPHLVSAVCQVVRERVVRGAPVSTEALHGLRGFATVPHLVGSDLSLDAYTVFVRGLTNFYQVAKDPEGDDTVLSPSAMMAKFSQELSKRALTEPTAVADVVALLGSVPVSPHLLSDLDSLLWNTAHPNRTNVPTEVRVAAIHAIANRVKAPPVSFHCEDRVGIIDACSASRLFLQLAHRSSEEQVLLAVFQRLSDILEPEASAMVSSWGDVERSSFVEKGVTVNLTGELQRVLERVSGEIEGFGPHSELFLRIEDSVKQAERVESAVAVYKLGSFLAKFLSRSWGERVQTGLLICLRRWDRLLHAPRHVWDQDGVSPVE